jgi:DnaJ-class molecular chaperone
MDLYKILGVERSASASEIRKAYLKLSKTAHPDKGGNEEEFKKITKAHEILTNEESKQFYDQTGQIPGENGAPEAGQGMGGFPGFGGGVPFDLGAMFGHMFGGGGGGFHGGPTGQGPRPRQKRGEKAPPKVQHIPVSLRQLYGGYVINFSFDRLKFCTDCKGSGAKSKETCGVCRGRGVQERMMQMGPGMMVHTTGPCGKCGGSGEELKESCKPCTGSGRTQEIKEMKVNIESGMKEGDSIVFENACSDDPDYDKAGDVHIILKNADDDNGWIRRGDDLENTVTLSYKDSLIGTTIKMTGHPRADELWIDIPAAVVSGDILTIPNEGMPIRVSKGRKGNLKLHIKVQPTKAEREVIKSSDQQLKDIFNVKDDTEKQYPSETHIKTGTIE